MYNFFLFLTKVDFLKYFQSLSEQKNFRPTGPKFWLFSKIAFYLSIKIFEKKKFSKKTYEILFFFWTLKEKSAYYRFFLAVLSILHFFGDPRDCLGMSCCFWRESVLEKTSTLSETFLALWHNFFGLVVKSAFYGLMGMFWRGSIFSIDYTFLTNSCTV